MAGKPLSQLKLDHLVKEVVNEKLLHSLAGSAIAMIRIRTKLGYGVAGEKLGGAQQKLEKLKDSTVQRRQRQELHPDTSPKKSNLTETGQLLDSINYEIVGGKINVFISGERENLVASYVSEARPFFTLSKSEVSRLADQIQKAINTHLSKGK